MTKEIKFYSELANQILHKNTDYFKDKQIIKKIFSSNGEDHQEIIRLRLTIIDSYYSTNMSRRYYGIENISKQIFDHYKDDQSLKNDLLSFINEPLNNVMIRDIFNKPYGISKGGEPKGKAMSLISKYAYFLTDFQFPIYDSIVFETYQKITNRFPELGLNMKLSTEISDFVRIMNLLNKSSKINDFDKLDNLLWLIGKILRGNFSLILNEATYKEFVKPIDKDSKTLSKDIDKKIREHSFLNLDKLKHLIDDDLYTMISFAKEINNYTA
ncbi:MAG: hypothetical protein M0R39_11240 [Prolixibacteraceae bacterium]|nr:hypothetical protein [Prolixibacteraceae bacterium]